MKKILANKKNRLMALVVVGLVVVIGILTVASKLIKPAKETVAPAVAVVTAQNGDVSETLDTSGTVKSMNSKTFFSPVNAEVKKVAFEVGDTVKNGTQLIEFDLTDLEKENQKAEWNVQTGQYDYSDAVNQANTAAGKKATAQANAANLQAAVDDWQAYVNDLKAQINQANSDATADAQAAASEAQKEYSSEFKKYQKELKKLYTDMLNKETAYNQKVSAYNVAFTVWEYNQTEENLAKVNAADDAQVKAKEAWERAEYNYETKQNLAPTAPSYDSSGAVADTAQLQQELEDASSYLAELKGDLASEEAMADADGTTLSKEARAKLEINTNLAELEAKTAEELIAEGKRGIQAEFNGVISDSKIISGAAAVQGGELFTLQSTDDVSVEVKISKYDYDKLKEGQKAIITLANNKYEGTVTKISRIALTDEKGNATIGATVHIDNPDENVFLGVEAKVVIQAADAKGVLVVPSEVVNIDSEGSFCYVIEKGVIVKRAVETGVTSASEVEIKSGLKAGDQIVKDMGMMEEGSPATAMENSEAVSEPTDVEVKAVQ